MKDRLLLLPADQKAVDRQGRQSGSLFQTPVPGVSSFHPSLALRPHPSIVRMATSAACDT